MASPVEYQPCPLQFYDFRQLEVQKNCIKYYEVTQGQEITVDDLESLHAELMLLKEHVQNRIQTLQSESVVLNEWQVKRDYSKRRRHSDVSDSLPVASSSNTATASSKGHALDQPPPSKRSKASDERKTSRVKPSSKGKNAVSTTTTHYTEQDMLPSTDSAIRKPRTEGADRFWASVEPYCANITDVELKILQEPGALNDMSLFSIPALGRHYSQQWAMEDISEEVTRRYSSSENMWQSEAESLLKDGISQSKTIQNGCGPLTQKLMSAFLDTSNGALPAAQYHRLSSDVPSTTPTLLENRIKEELVSLGLLDNISEQEKEHHEDDEILKELKKVQAELRTVCEYNQQQKQMLYSLARAEMRRQDIRKQLEEVDMEIMGYLQRFASYRQRKKREPISRKEREAAHRALDIRQKLTKQLLV